MGCSLELINEINKVFLTMFGVVIGIYLNRLLKWEESILKGLKKKEKIGINLLLILGYFMILSFGIYLVIRFWLPFTCKLGSIHGALLYVSGWGLVSFYPFWDHHVIKAISNCTR